jgi:hypothetical protein
MNPSKNIYLAQRWRLDAILCKMSINACMSKAGINVNFTKN